MENEIKLPSHVPTYIWYLVNGHDITHISIKYSMPREHKENQTINIDLFN